MNGLHHSNAIDVPARKRKELTTFSKCLLAVVVIWALGSAWHRAQDAHRAAMDAQLPTYNAEGKRLR